LKIIDPSFSIEGTPLSHLDGIQMLEEIEEAGRTCYKSKSKPGSYINFIKNIIALGHESVLEHKSVSVRIMCPGLYKEKEDKHESSERIRIK
jgi:thymidylate synthase (FAD)